MFIGGKKEKNKINLTSANPLHLAKPFGDEYVAGPDVKTHSVFLCVYLCVCLRVSSWLGLNVTYWAVASWRHWQFSILPFSFLAKLFISHAPAPSSRFFFQSLFIPPVNIPLACPCSKLYFYPKCICCASCCRDFTVRSLTGMDVEQSVWTMRVCVKGLGALIWLELNQSYTKSTHTRAQNAHMNLLPNFVVMNAHTSRSIGALHQHTNPLCLFDLLLGIRQSLPGGF